MSNIFDLLGVPGAAPAPAPAPAPTPEPVAKTTRATKPAPAKAPTAPAEPVTETPDTASGTDLDAELDEQRLAEQDLEIQLAADAYKALLPEIIAARPQLPTYETQPEKLTGEEWVIGAWKAALFGGEADKFGLDSTFGVAVFARADAVIIEVTVPEHLAGPGRAAVAAGMIAEATRRQNLGLYEAQPAGDKAKFFLVRRGAIDTSSGWSAQPKTAAFHRGGDYRRNVWSLAGLVRKAPTTGLLQYPQPSFRTGDRGGEAVLSLPPGMLPDDAVRAQAALRQALASPSLTVDVGDGLHPVVRLNTRALVKEFPKNNPLRASMFVQPRTLAERHNDAPFMIPLGVREDGSAILVNQDVTPHVAIFGGTGQGKTVLLSQIVKAAVLQSAEVILVDGKNGKDLRNIALSGLPGVVHYSSNSEAGLHRAVTFCRDELERRKVLAAKLQQQRIDYRPTPLLMVFDEAGAWLDDMVSGSDKGAKAAAAATIANFSYLAAQSREQRIFLLTAGQHAYVSAFSGKWKSNTSTTLVLGPPTDQHVQALFAGPQRDRVVELGATIGKTMKGRGIVADSDTGRATLFQGYFNAPGPDAVAFDAAVMKAPKLRRFAWRFPDRNAEGGDGSWMSWTPTSDPSSDELPVQVLDLPDGTPDPAAARYDPISPMYSPGRKPLAPGHARVN